MTGRSDRSFLNPRSHTRNVFLWAALMGLAAGGPDSAGFKFRPRRGDYRLALEGIPWSLLFKIRGFEVEAENTRPDGTGTGMRAIHDDTGVVVSVFLERSPTLRSAEECRDYYWGRTVKDPPRRTAVEFRRTATMALVESMVEEFQGTPIMQKNINAYLFRDGVCVDFQVSKVFFEPGEEELLAAVLHTVRFSRPGPADGFCQ